MTLFILLSHFVERKENMSVSAHRAIRKEIENEKSTITDRDFFTSRNMQSHLEDLAAALTKRYSGRKRIQVRLMFRPDMEAVAYTNNHVITINVAHDEVWGRENRLARYSEVISLFTHELGHCLYTDFTIGKMTLNGLFDSAWEPHNGKLAYFISLSDDDMRRNADFWEWLNVSDFRMKEQKVQAVFSVLHDLDNILEDAYIENRLLDEYPGNLGTALSVSRKRELSYLVPLDAMVEQEDPEKVQDRFFTIRALIFAYAKFGELVLGSASVNDERVNVLCELMDIIDSVFTATPEGRAAVSQSVFIHCWDYIKPWVDSKIKDAHDFGSAGSVSDDISDELRNSSIPTSCPGTGTLTDGKPIAGSKAADKDEAGPETEKRMTRTRVVRTAVKKSKADKSTSEGTDPESESTAPGEDDTDEADDSGPESGKSAADSTDTESEPETSGEDDTDEADDSGPESGESAADSTDTESEPETSDEDDTDESEDSVPESGESAEDGTDTESEPETSDEDDTDESDDSAAESGESAVDSTDTETESTAPGEDDTDESDDSAPESEESAEDGIDTESEPETSDEDDCSKNSAADELPGITSPTSDYSKGADESADNCEYGSFPDITPDEGGRIPEMEQERSECSEDGTIDYNDDYESLEYENAASDIDRILESMAEERAYERLESEFQSALNKEARSIDYGELHHGIDIVVNRMITVPESLKEQYEYISPKLLKISRHLQKSVKQKLKDIETGGKRTGLVYGRRIQETALCRNDGKIFYKNNLPQDIPQIAVGLLLDESGSMRHSDRATYARATAIIIYDFCKALNIPCMIYGHTCNWAGTEVQMLSYAEFDEIDPDNKYRLMDISARCDNRDGMAVRFVCERLSKRPETVKLFMLVSDGQPLADGYGGDPAYKELRTLKHQYKRKNVQFVAAAIGSDKEVIERIYQDSYLDISDLNELPKKLTDIIKRNLRLI